MSRSVAGAVDSMARARGRVAVDVSLAVLVRWPRGEVVAFMFDPGNDLRWSGGITSGRPTNPGPLVEGATVQRTAKFLCRTFTYGCAVTRHQPDQLVDMKVDRPFPMLVRYELRAADGGALVPIRATGSPGHFFGWATPLMVRKDIAANLERLRHCLEA
jgi:Polyketide cyclase / dehydrase and lipid transport